MRLILVMILVMMLFPFTPYIWAQGYATCTVTATVYTSDGVPARAKIRVLKAEANDGRIITLEPKEWSSDSTGHLVMTLPRDSRVVLASKEIAELPWPTGLAVLVPNVASATLRSLLPATAVPDHLLVAVPGCDDLVLAQLSDSLDVMVRVERDPHYLADQAGIYSGISGAQQTADQAAQAAQNADQAAQQAQNSANDAYQYADQVHQEAEGAQSAAESANATALLAMDTAKSRATPGTVRAAIRDSLEHIPRIERDPVYLAERSSLFSKSDTVRLHADILSELRNLIQGRRDSTTINGVKGTSFTIVDTSSSAYWTRTFLELIDTNRVYSGRLKALENAAFTRRDSTTINGVKATAFTVPTIADSTMPYAFVGGAMTLYRGTRFGVLSLSTAAPSWVASGTTVFGLGAGSASTTGTNNTLMGYSAANALTSGYENTFLGSRAGIRNKTGYGHTGVGDQTLYSAWDGANVTALGSQAGYYHAHGRGAIYIGRNAGPAVQDTGVTYNYSIALGTNARPTRSNQMVIGGAGAGIDTTHIGNGVWNSTPTSVVLKSTNPLPNDGGSTPGGNITLMAGSAGTVRSGSVRIVTSGQQRLAIDSTGTLEGNSQMRGTTTIGAGDSVQVSVPGATPTDVVMATYNIGKTAVAAGDTILSCKIWSVGTLTIYGVQSRKVSWIRFK